ncbi:MAG: DUF4878 domain-containing protein [Firmicutes bacterium]|jgi:uncharacterized protein YchJ|nr:DUF4878 domain-containing protein [Bacillota bacterium]
MTKKVVMELAAVFLFVLLLVHGCSLFKRSPQSAPQRLAEAYLEAFKSGDFDLMLSYCRTGEMSAEELEFTRSFVEMIQLIDYSIDRVEQISPNEAQVEITVTLSLMGAVRTNSDRLRMIKEDGKWYVAENIF